MMMLAAATDKKAFAASPIVRVATFVAPETLGPTQLDKVIGTGLFSREVLVEFGLIFGEIIWHFKRFHI
jgi:hypothetical protein